MYVLEQKAIVENLPIAGCETFVVAIIAVGIQIHTDKQFEPPICCITEHARHDIGNKIASRNSDIEGKPIET